MQLFDRSEKKEISFKELFYLKLFVEQAPDGPLFPEKQSALHQLSSKSTLFSDGV